MGKVSERPHPHPRRRACDPRLPGRKPSTRRRSRSAHSTETEPARHQPPGDPTLSPHCGGDTAAGTAAAGPHPARAGRPCRCHDRGPVEPL